MGGDGIITLGSSDVEERIRQELEQPLGADRQRKFRRFVLAALGSLPWVGGVVAVAAALDSDQAQQKVNELQQEWLDAHREKLGDVRTTLAAILPRLETVGPEIEARLQTEEYLALVRQAFRVWDQAESRDKRDLIQKLLTNAGGTPLTADDVVRLFIQWIDFYHESHFAVIRAIYRSQGATRADIWTELHGVEVREDSAEADLFKMLIRDLSTGSVIRQQRETNNDGSFVKKTPARRPRGIASRVMKSAFDDDDQYELTELGKQFVHYTMNEMVPRLGG